MSEQQSGYYFPPPSNWPLVGSIGVFTMLVGFANWLHDKWYGPWLFTIGAAVLAFMMWGWFGRVIRENVAGMYNWQVGRSYRWAMGWFIFSEACFFAAFFGALFYVRYWVVPLLGGDMHPESHLMLWPDFKAIWPLLVNPDNAKFVGPHDVIAPWGIPALNTLLLLSSGVTLTWSHWALKKQQHAQTIWGLVLTIALGITFLGFQVHEYILSHQDYALTMSSGIYGSTFFMLTGFHGFHVTVGTIMLIVILGRAIKRHFTPEKHFAFEAVAWYWHFVDVVWLMLFVLVYWL